MFSSNTSQVSDATFIEDVFSTWLYTGTGTTQTINNGIDLAGKGGLVWNKSRSNAFQHSLTDTVRGAGNSLDSSDTAANDFTLTRVSAFLADGFTMGGNSRTNASGSTYASWTFREQPRFFDVVTWTGNGFLPRVIPHNLGSVPGCIIAKRTDLAGDWYVYHRRLNNGVNPEQYVLSLNSTAATAGPGSIWGPTAPTATGFNVGSGLNTLPASGITPTYVAYVFAHDAGGFGATGTDNVISCGSYTGDGGTGATTVTLGYEPQWLLIKQATGGADNWAVFDNMRGIAVNNNASNDVVLMPNTSNSESTVGAIEPTATGFRTTLFTNYNASGQTYIYVAIRRGPMRTPTTGTSVFSPIASSAATGTALTTGFPVDAQIFNLRTGTTNKGQTVDRLRGISSTTTESGAQLITNSTAAETTANIPTRLWDNTSFQMPSSYGGASMVFWNFRRAPGFFDVVCYTGDGTTNRSVSMNLSAAPEFAIIKRRNSTSDWIVGDNSLGANLLTYWTTLCLNTSAARGLPAVTVTLGSPFTAFGVPDTFNVNAATYVAYLFASCPGVSRVGSYTGTGATQTINCGFSSGARFILIKRTDAAGDWYVWDSARGIVAANDPYLVLNSTAAEVTNTDWVDTAASGFELSNAAGNLVNTNGASYIFLAIA